MASTAPPFHLHSLLAPRDDDMHSVPSLSMGLSVAANSAAAGPGPPPPLAPSWQHALDDHRLDGFFSRFSRFTLGGAATADTRSNSLADRVRNSLAALRVPLPLPPAPLPLPPQPPADLDTIRLRLMSLLTSDDIALIEAAEPETVPTVILAQINGGKFSRADLRLLDPGQWLNDTIINYYGLLLRKVGEISHAAGRAGASAWTFSSFFYTRLIQNKVKYDFPGIERWTKTVDIFLYQRLLIPINRENVHWALALIDMRTRTISYYDSLRGSGADVIKTLIRWIGDEHMAKKKVPIPEIFTSAPAPDGLTRQRNGVDCGVFVCAMMTCLLYDVVPLNTLFSQNDIGLWRRKIAAACLAKTIVDASLNEI
jgi:hypothetical protein